MSEKKDHKIQILVAVIGVIGVITAAVISNWDKLASVTSQSEGKELTALNANLDKVIFYKGDKGIGNKNTCPSDQILVREVYRIKNVPFPQPPLKLHHSSPSGSREIPVKNIRKDLVDYNFCSAPSLLNSYDVKTVFIDTTNNGKSNVVEFKISLKDKKIEKPEEWGKLFN